MKHIYEAPNQKAALEDFARHWEGYKSMRLKAGVTTGTSLWCSLSSPWKSEKSSTPLTLLKSRTENQKVHQEQTVLSNQRCGDEIHIFARQGGH